ncbi:hypothetical protein L903_11430 [Agrobacterium sp. JL28]|nr:hypothetical protein L902_21210 [Agrobacterium radiobacter DSM 30147]KVK42736.1 hypothetical protein L904_11410 [Agrobacterium sp. LY4]KVK43069.1 hypothetical protein L903_11430 [Agrobacterium sp. JL28]
MRKKSAAIFAALFYFIRLVSHSARILFMGRAAFRLEPL